MRLECWTSQGSLSIILWKSFWYDWTATVATHNCMACCEIVLAVTASWLICVYGFCLCGFRSWKSYILWFLRVKELLKLLQRFWLGRAWPIIGRSCGFILLDSIFWYITEHIYIPPFDILLMVGLTEILHVLRPALFLDCTQHKLVIPFWCFGITNWSHFKGQNV
jgi:hypothetical protein